ncbi:MAG: hypothetical protein N4A59_04330 [Marinifilum sp.]|jgi:hypothetical protein|nr:hypothetical protein [Marinifilum sp.]
MSLIEHGKKYQTFDLKIDSDIRAMGDARVFFVDKAILAYKKIG